jgi:hypothetical protein
MGATEDGNTEDVRRQIDLEPAFPWLQAREVTNMSKSGAAEGYARRPK